MKMKGIKLFLLALVAGVFMVSCDSAKEGGEGEGGGETAGTETEVAATPEAYAITTDGAEVMWTGSKSEGAHYGSLALSGGSVEVTGDGITGGSATIDLAGMTVMDEGLDEETKGKLIGHLSSEDFFNVAAHPNVTVAITGSEAYSGGGETIPDDTPEALESYFITAPTHNIMAKLTIKGEEHEITFPASIKMAEGSLDAAAFISFDRREYGLRFMSDTEANVNPTIHLGVKFSAAKQAS